MLNTVNIIGGEAGYQTDPFPQTSYWKSDAESHDGIFCLTDVTKKKDAAKERYQLIRLQPAWSDMAWNEDYVIGSEALNLATKVTRLSLSFNAVFLQPDSRRFDGYKANVRVRLNIPDVTQLDRYELSSNESGHQLWEPDAMLKAQQLIDWYRRERERSKLPDAVGPAAATSVIDASSLLQSRFYHGNPMAKQPIEKQCWLVFDSSKSLEDMELIPYLDYVYDQI
jgi:hypothetical protein